MDELEFALEKINGHIFEDLAMAFLREEGYQVHESGSSGKDGGWDARVKIGDKKGIAHASKQKTWRRKLRKDASKVKSLEDENAENYDLLVFVTSRSVTGQQELELEEEIKENYGWKLRIHHRDNILGEIRQNKSELASTFLDVDLTKDREHRRQHRPTAFHFRL